MLKTLWTLLTAFGLMYPVALMETTTEESRAEVPKRQLALQESGGSLFVRQLIPTQKLAAQEDFFLTLSSADLFGGPVQSLAIPYLLNWTFIHGAAPLQINLTGTTPAAAGHYFLALRALGIQNDLAQSIPFQVGPLSPTPKETSSPSILASVLIGIGLFFAGMLAGALFCILSLLCDAACIACGKKNKTKSHTDLGLILGQL